MNQQTTINIHLQKAEDILIQPGLRFSEKRILNRDAEEYLIEEAEALPVKDNITLLIQAEEKNTLSEDLVIKAIHKHFESKSQKAIMKVRNILELGWKSLLISFMFLVVMSFIALAITRFLPENTLMITFRELFIILGWVALWRPADLLLYEWRGYKRNAQLFRRLAQCKVNFIE